MSHYYFAEILLNVTINYSKETNNYHISYKQELLNMSKLGIILQFEHIVVGKQKKSLHEIYINEKVLSLKLSTIR